MVFIHSIVLSTQCLDWFRGRSTLGGLLYFRRTSDPLVAGASVRDFEMLRKLCGRSTLQNVAIVSCTWDGTSWGVRGAHECEHVDDFFKLVLDGGAQLVRYDNDARSSAHDIIRRMVRNPELNEKVRRHQNELGAVRREVIKALRDQEDALRGEFKQEILQRGFEQEALQGEFEQEIRKIREQTRVELERGIRKVQEQAKVELEENCEVLEQVRVELEQEIHNVREQVRVELKQARVELEQTRVELERARVESEQEIRKVKEQTRVELDQEIHKAREQARVESEWAIRKIREHTRNRGGELFPP